MTFSLKRFLYNEQAATRRLNVASVTLSCDRDPDTNRSKIVRTVNAIMQMHPDIDLVVFGEMTLGLYNPGAMPGYHRRISETLTQETLQTLGALSAQHGIYLCFGLSEAKDDKLHNAQVLLNPLGEVQAVHRKRNLKPGEKALYQPGPVLVTVTNIKRVRTGIVICSDAASPRTMWELMKSHLDLIILSLADDSDDELFMAKFNARMYDAWIVTANRYGDENGQFWNGHTVISDPCGELRVTGQGKEQWLVYELAFVDGEPWIKRTIRNAWVKMPLAFFVIRHWKKAMSYL